MYEILRIRLVAPVFVFFVLLNGRTADAAPMLVAPFNANYTIADLGPVRGVPSPLGGLTLTGPGSNTLLIGGAANTASGAIYSVGVVRGAGGHIIGFSGSATQFATAPNIDGGLAFGPGGVLFFTAFPTNALGQIKSGSASPDKVTPLSGLGVTSSTGSLGFVPAGFDGAGELKLVSFNGGDFHTLTLAPDGMGTFDIVTATQETVLPGGPEGFAYVPLGSPQFPAPSLLLSEFSTGEISAFFLDANGNPIPGSRRLFLTGLTGAEGAFIDPVTGDFLFSTFGGGDRVIVVRGFQANVIPEPSSLFIAVTLSSFGFLSWHAFGRRRRRSGAPKK